MHSTFANINLEKVRRRISEGDCATTPALSVEALEELVVHFADTYHSALPGEHGELVERLRKPYGQYENEITGERRPYYNSLHTEAADALTAAAATIADLRATLAARDAENERPRRQSEVLLNLRTDIMILHGNVLDASKIDTRWEGMPDRISGWLKRIDTALSKDADHG